MVATGNSISIEQLAIPIFKGEHYKFWSIKMKTLFKSQDLWELVENGYADPDEEVRLMNNRKKDSMALVFIQQAVHETLFSTIEVATTSKEAWTTLQTKFDTEEVQELVEVERQEQVAKNLQAINEKQDELVQKLEKKTIQLLNFYIVFQGVILTAIAQGSLLTSDHWWVPFILSLSAFFIDVIPAMHAMNKCLQARIALEFNRSELETVHLKINELKQRLNGNPPNDIRPVKPDGLNIFKWRILAWWTGFWFCAITAVVLAACPLVVRKHGKEGT